MVKKQKPDRCPKCHAPIIWCRMAQQRNRSMPLDPERSTSGSIELRGNLGYQILGANKPAALKLYVSHYVTCPQAQDDRRSK